MYIVHIICNIFNYFYFLYYFHFFISISIIIIIIIILPSKVDLLLGMHHSPSDDPPELTDQQKETLEGLKEKIETIIKEYGEAGAFLRLNTKTPTDSILERNDCDYIQSIQVMEERGVKKNFIIIIIIIIIVVVVVL